MSVFVNYIFNDKNKFLFYEFLYVTFNEHYEQPEDFSNYVFGSYIFIKKIKWHSSKRSNKANLIKL